MKLLIDECLPRALKRLLAVHTCKTVQEMGWAGKKNGLLLSLAEKEFEVLITIDQGFEYQQNLGDRKGIKGQATNTVARAKSCVGIVSISS